MAHPARLSLFRSNTAGDKYCCFFINSESCIRETLLQQEKSKLCFSPSLNKGQQMPAELLSRVLRKRIFSTRFLWQTDEKTSIRVCFLFNRKKEKQLSARILTQNLFLLWITSSCYRELRLKIL